VNNWEHTGGKAKVQMTEMDNEVAGESRDVSVAGGVYVGAELDVRCR
jgi:hypothetical protein